MSDRTVTDLVGSLLEASGTGDAGDREAGRAMADAGAVEITAAGPDRVTAVVEESGKTYEVELASTDGGLLARCSCTIVRSPQLCPHGFATAFIAWDEG